MVSLFPWEVSICPPPPGKLLTDKLQAFGKMLSSSRACLALTAHSTCQRIFIPSLSAVSEIRRMLGGMVSVSLMLEFFSPFQCFLSLWLDRRSLEILSWIMRHWTEVLFVSQVKVSIALLADGLSIEWQTDFCCPSMQIPKVWRSIFSFPLYCGQQSEQRGPLLH